MTENVRVKALEQIMPATHGADEDIDWRAAEALWNTRFPADFVAFMGRFGAGSINGEASILPPLPQHGPQWDPPGMAEETGNARQLWRDAGGRAALDADPATIIAWGVTGGSDILCWLACDPDPDRWPVLVVGRHTAEPFAVYPYGMAEFLYRLCSDEFDVSPVGLTFWDGGHLSFVHWRKAQRRWQEGRNPETGDPDPYAGEFGP
ncbi:SMI1/KNR4 family protein [Streptomyces sp. 2P-4]|uniref:SMI1/KNR4 family protein n=1 Tax=Streptomyces sp. 2P-4 TaxID=2931974 RepID=UPI0025415F86|nr:SMI1/KNR4 family protein [Streptomyces sp. 2P-4]